MFSHINPKRQRGFPWRSPRSRFGLVSTVGDASESRANSRRHLQRPPVDGFFLAALLPSDRPVGNVDDVQLDVFPD